MSFSNTEYERRHKKAKDLMDTEDLDALLMSDVYNYFYFSGHQVSAHPMRRYFMILPRGGKPVLIFYGNVMTHLEVYKMPSPWWDKIEDLRPYVDSPHMPGRVKDWGIADAMKDLGISKGRIGCELGESMSLEMPYNDFLKLKKDLPEAKFVDASNIFWKCRMYKSEEEVERMRKACEITGKTWNKLWETVKPGMTRGEISALLSKIYIEEGSSPRDPGGGVATPHGTGPKGTFVKGDMIRLDGGATYRGYKADYGRSACFGEPSHKQKKYYELIVDITQKIIEAMKVGVKMKEIHKLNNKLLKEAGLPTSDPIKRVGHGQGLQSEPPSINQIDTWYNVVKPGLITTPEPRFDIKDTSPWRFHYEETVLTTKDGYEILSTQPTSELVIIEC